MEKKTAEPRDGETMKAETEKASSRILEMIGLKARLTRGRAMLIDCSGYEPEGKVQQTRHPWSISGFPFEELEKAYAGMRTALPKSGWRITSDGPNESAAKTPTLVANSPNGDFSVKLRLMDRRGDANPEATTSLIHVAVVSRCFEDAPS
ncbi:hypothetical protein ACFYRC_02230 [Streptomyces sp. NPDC005279]|uniref:hypothetical protein n=1 Tax=Streptomyces sp. NPDC005279 TaxID=3364712 RepID=UPI003698501F